MLEMRKRHQIMYGIKHRTVQWMPIHSYHGFMTCFPSVDGTVLEFIAHNRRRCKTGRKHRPDVLRLEPQVALMQHVSVERITPAQAQTLAPELWNSKDEDSSTTTTTAPTFQQYRYRLAPMNESSPDGQFTRFLCRFHGTVLQQGNPQSVIIDETLSVFPYNYEFVSYRKGKPTMITPKGKDNRYFWTSVFEISMSHTKIAARLGPEGRNDPQRWHTDTPCGFDPDSNTAALWSR
jgi:hypothetical protein